MEHLRFTSDQTDEFACGCRPGWFMCPEAEQLWRKVGDAYNSAQYARGTWDAYKAAQQAYYDHYKELEEVK